MPEPAADLRLAATAGVELAAWATTVALVLSFGRVFVDWSFAPRLVLVATAAHLLPTLARRIGLGPRLAVPLDLALGTVVLAVTYLPETTFVGLPTADTAVQAGTAMRDAFGPFQQLVAPVPASLGFQLALAVAVWVVATFCDAAAVWAAATVQAVIPHVAAFAFGAVLARSDGALPATVGFGGTLALLALAARTRRTAGARFATGDGDAGRRSQLRSGAAIVATVVVGLGLLAPLVPGVTTQGWVDLRRLGKGNGPRVVDSPLVGLDALLGERSNEEMFTVTGAPRPHYWRLTALEVFDGTTWSSNATYRDVDDGEELPTAVPVGGAGTEERHRFRITGLASNWLPAAAVPRAVNADFDVRFHAPSASLFVADDEATTAGRSYSVDSAVGTPDLGTLLRADGADGADGADAAVPTALTALPSGRSGALGLRAAEATAGAEGDVARALALERWFRDPANGFTYDRTADFRGAADPLGAFLDARRGFCQQYAGAFAALARALGIPARVAVGFTYGDPDPTGTTWTVRGRHAHAWPEVFLRGVGWVALEPTPGRGNPDAEPYTGRPASQELPGGGTGGLEATTTTTTTTIAAAVPTSAPAVSAPDDRARRATTATGDDGGLAGPVLLALLVLVGLVAAAVGGRWTWVQRRDGAGRRGPPAARVAAAWRTASRLAERLGVAADATETPHEAGERLARHLGSDAPRTLATLESDRRYAPDEPDEAAAEAAEAAEAEIRELVAAGLGRGGRTRLGLDL